ncbi:MAG: hypothetical protein H6726_28855 [Sandaracinaceae bacterium]|nr:hypothetical protein [Sandaracinaceae bacterium]
MATLGAPARAGLRRSERRDPTLVGAAVLVGPWARIGCAALVALSLLPGAARAQQRFGDYADEATEVSGSLLELANPVLENCHALSGAARRTCTVRVRNASRELNGHTYLYSMPAGQHLRFDPYEPMGGGFRVYLEGFEQHDDTRVVATRETASGVLPAHTVAQGFSVVPASAAAAFLTQNVAERLVLRIVFRFGDTFRDGERQGVELNLVAAQVYNDSTGGVLLDTTRTPGPPQEPHVLDRRVRLWDSNGHAEALWRAPDGRRFVFHVENQPLLTPPNSSAPLLNAWHGARRQGVVHFIAPCCTANVSVAPRGPDTLTVIITERAPQGNVPGQGQVAVIRFVPARGIFRVVARWRGSNTERPPAWVLDPNAPLPSEDDVAAEGPAESEVTQAASE